MNTTILHLGKPIRELPPYDNYGFLVTDREDCPDCSAITKYRLSRKDPRWGLAFLNRNAKLPSHYLYYAPHERECPSDRYSPYNDPMGRQKMLDAWRAQFIATDRLLATVQGADPSIQIRPNGDIARWGNVSYESDGFGNSWIIQS